jgi:hypothetical protein
MHYRKSSRYGAKAHRDHFCNPLAEATGNNKIELFVSETIDIDWKKLKSPFLLLNFP